MTRSLLKDNALFFEWAMRLLDPLLVAAVGAAAYGVYLDDPMLAERYTLAIIGMTFACAALFPFVGLYSSQRGVTLFEEVRRLVNAWLLLATAWFAFLFLSKTGTDFSRVWSIYWIIAGFLVHLAVRGAIRVTLRMLRRRGYNVRRIAIVGAGEFGREIAQRIGKMPWSGLHVRGFYDDEPPLHRARRARRFSEPWISCFATWRAVPSTRCGLPCRYGRRRGSAKCSRTCAIIRSRCGSCRTSSISHCCITR